ncbi:MAG TPA: anti-sigma regulatory factor [Clostridiaceae bacterium]|nr:anti-sigma regulatory factor [Clostridiaceae bacterium]
MSHLLRELHGDSEYGDVIELVMPFKADFVSVSRLTASGIASRVGFDIDSIEDIKVTVSEVCSKIVEKGSVTAKHYKIIFRISEEELRIVFDCEDKSIKCIFDESDDGLSISIIRALMDKVELCPNNNYILSMSKTFKEKF